MVETPLAFTGHLDISTVAPLHAQALARHRRGQLPEIIDLVEVSRADSAGLALLLELAAWARASDRELTFTNPPESLRVLAELSHADELLGWNKEETLS